jgi:hypothetical protein
MCHSRGCTVGCIGRISHTNLKIRVAIYRIATSKNHIEVLVPGEIWDRFCDPEQTLVKIGLSATSRPEVLLVFGWRPAGLTKSHTISEGSRFFDWTCAKITINRESWPKFDYRLHKKVPTPRKLKLLDSVGFRLIIHFWFVFFFFGCIKRALL